MVKIQKLVLKNFKSFRKAEIPFADGFTVVVGSNGSGKSNILDGLMFAMGATSLKMLRASRLTDLVNNNAEENYAKVDLYIKHDGKGYEISRMIDKQGRCVYRLDGKKVTLNEITSLLGELGIRVDGHNIVMQGDVTRVIEMSPEERRQIIDELAGLQEFDEKKEEAMKNLEKVEDKIRETTIILQERENYLQELEKERESALLFETLEEEKRQLKATLLSAGIEKIREQLSENSKKAREALSKKEELQQKVQEQEGRMRQNREKARELNESIIAANEQMFSSVGAKLEEKRSEIMVNNERNARKKDFIERNGKRALELNGRIKALNEEKKQLEDERIGIESGMPEIERNIEAMQKQRQEIERLHSGKHNEMQKIEVEVKELGQRIELLRRQEISKEGEIENIKMRQSSDKEKVQELIAEKGQAEKAVAELEKKQQLLEAIYAKEKNPEAALHRNREMLEKKISESRGKQAIINSQQERAAMLQKQIAACPVCETRLEEDKRKQLLNKTNDRIKQESIELSRLLEDEKNTKNRIKELEELFFRERELRLVLKDLPLLREKNKALEEKIRAAKSALDMKAIEAIENEAKKAREQAKLLMAENERLEGRRNELIERLQLEELNKLSRLIGDALTQKKLSEQRIMHIETALGARLEKDKKLLLNEIESLKEENSLIEKEIAEGREKVAMLEKEAKELEAKLESAESENREKIKKRDVIEEELESMGEKIASLQQKIKSIEQQENAISVENSGLGVRLSDLEEEFRQFSAEKRLKEFNEAEARKRLDSIEKQVAELGAINMKAMESFNELASEVNDVKGKVAKLEEERLAVLEMIEKIEVKRTNVFMDCFQELNRNFSNTFFSLFGGEGLLSLSEPDKPMESGLIIEARHKGNNLQNIDSMSGGEKTLTALAFLFAIQLYEPAPFYVFDEADAALDKENSMKMVNIIKETSKKSQFIAITHNDPLIKEADQIIGVALNKQKSSVIGLRLREEIVNNEENRAMG